MEDHQADLLGARDALVRGDLAGARWAGARLAIPDMVPRLPDEVQPRLDALRFAGARLAEATSRQDAAEVLTSITTHCSGCHMALEVPTPLSSEAAPVVNQLWLALAWDDAKGWERAAVIVDPAGSTIGGAITWADRRGAMAIALTDGTFR